MYWNIEKLKQIIARANHYANSLIRHIQLANQYPLEYIEYMLNQISNPEHILGEDMFEKMKIDSLLSMCPDL